MNRFLILVQSVGRFSSFSNRFKPGSAPPEAMSLYQLEVSSHSSDHEREIGRDEMREEL